MPLFLRFLYLQIRFFLDNLPLIFQPSSILIYNKGGNYEKVLKIAGITLGVLLILILVLPFAFQGKIEKLVKQEGNKMLNAQFDFSALDISLIRNFPSASITLEDFWLKGAGEFQNDTLIQAGELTAAVNLFSLFGNSGYDISKIIIEDQQQPHSCKRLHQQRYNNRTGPGNP